MKESNLIIRLVSEKTGVPESQIFSGHRSRETVNARRMCAALMRRYTLLPLKDITRILGLTNHTTIIYYTSTHDDFMDFDKEYSRVYLSIETLYKNLNKTEHDIIGYTISYDGTFHGFFVHYESAHSNSKGGVVTPILSLNKN